MEEQYIEKAMDEVYDIMLYNPTFIDVTTKFKVLKKLLEHYLHREDYMKCKSVQELIDMMENHNENNNKKSG